MFFFLPADVSTAVAVWKVWQIQGYDKVHTFFIIVATPIFKILICSLQSFCVHGLLISIMKFISLYLTNDWTLVEYSFYISTVDPVYPHAYIISSTPALGSLLNANVPSQLVRTIWFAMSTLLVKELTIWVAVKISFKCPELLVSFQTSNLHLITPPHCSSSKLRL